MLNKFFNYFEGECSPFPLAIFRIALYLGIGIHFFPSILWFQENYSTKTYRSMQWNETLYNLLPELPVWVVGYIAALVILGCLAGFLGYRPRLSAALTGLSTYILASFNSFNLQTLALGCVWGILLVWAIFGGGDEVLSIKAGFKTNNSSGKRLCRAILFIQLMIVVIFSGLEKIFTGWPGTNEMHTLLSYPQGFIVRDWVAYAEWSKFIWVGWIFTILTLCFELILPFTLVFQRTKMISLILWQIFFLGIVAMLEVPPLFYFIFAFGAFLVLPSRNKISDLNS